MKEKILLVDDNPDFLDSTKDVLEEAGYIITTASNGKEALSIYKQKNLPLVLMDIMMPGINGVDTFLKMKEANPDIKAVLITAYSMNDLIKKAVSEGVYEVLYKPLDMAVLLKLISKVLENKEN